MRSHRWLATSGFLPLTACATIIHGTRQNIPIVSRPVGAAVTVDSEAVGQTPVMARVRRTGGQLVRVELTGFHSYQVQLKRRLSPAVWWNALLYFAPLPIDFGTGGLFALSPGVVAASLLPTEPDRAPVIASDPPGIGLGTRVRWTVQGTDAKEGFFIQQAADSILAWPRRTPRPISLSISSALQLEKLGPSRHRHTELGAAIGAGAGALTGALFVGMVGALNASFGDKTARTGDYLAGAAMFGLGGAMEGALIGYFITGQSWEPVRLGRTELEPLIGKRQVGLAVRIPR